jgi:hypothetical protein
MPSVGLSIKKVAKMERVTKEAILKATAKLEVPWRYTVLQQGTPKV